MKAGKFTIDIVANNPPELPWASELPPDFYYVQAWQTKQYLELYGSVDEWEQVVERLTFRLDNAIPVGRYNLKSPQVKQVDVYTGRVGIAYLAHTLELNITEADHEAKGLQGSYKIETYDIYGTDSSVGPAGVTLTGEFRVNYMDTTAARR